MGPVARPGARPVARPVVRPGPDGPVRAPATPDALAALAAELRALPPSCGPVRLVAVDGHAGSGKTTFTARLAAALGGAPVVHLDDLATHAEPFGWTGRLRGQVLEPLAAGRDAEYEVYDWTLRRFAGTAAVPLAPVVLVEGSAPGGARCGRSWPGWCGWSWTRRRPGGGARSGTVRNWRSSGPAGRSPNRHISPRTRAARTPAPWSTG